MAYTPFNPYINPYYQPQLQQQPQMVQQTQQLLPTQMSGTTQPQSNQGLIWVSGEVGAKSYLVTPGSTVMLMDSEAERFYLKSADNAGMPTPLRIFEYKEVSQGQQLPPQHETTEYVTRKEYDEICGKYAELSNRLDELQKLKTGNRKKGDVDEQSAV